MYFKKSPNLVKFNTNDNFVKCLVLTSYPFHLALFLARVKPRFGCLFLSTFKKMGHSWVAAPITAPIKTRIPESGMFYFGYNLGQEWYASPSLASGKYFRLVQGK